MNAENSPIFVWRNGFVCEYGVEYRHCNLFYKKSGVVEYSCCHVRSSAPSLKSDAGTTA